MYLLKEQWENLGWETNNTVSHIQIVDVTQNSQEVKEGWSFFALDGLNHQGKEFVPEVLKKKPSAVFLNKKYQKEFEKLETEFPIFFSSNFATSFEQTLSTLFGKSLEAITLFGVTGTNGKTTIALLLKELISNLGVKTMYVGTLGAIIDNEHVAQNMTTPDIISLHRLIHRSVQKKVFRGFFEVSSHALDQGRIYGLNFLIGAFTNLSHDHLDYHKNIENYYKSKKLFFLHILSQKTTTIPHFIICTDGHYGKKLFKWLNQEPSKKKIFTYSLENESDLKIMNIKKLSVGYECEFLFKKKSYVLKSKLLGTFNLLNLACVFLVAFILGFTPAEIIEKIKYLSAVKGRMEPVYQKLARLIIIDYSHTPDALRHALSSLKELNFKCVHLVFGCGGDRDHQKRVLMGEIASKLADKILITNDNPRTEEPLEIAKEIEKGCKKYSTPYQICLDREKAIFRAISDLDEREVLLIAGKGHENYQVINHEKRYFSDHELVKRAFES